jgi:hypothetical protein
VEEPGKSAVQTAKNPREEFAQGLAQKSLKLVALLLD